MDRQAIIEELEAERDRLDNAIKAMGGWVSSGRRASTNGAGPRRRMSAAARKKISDAQKKRWAQHKAKR